MEAVSIAGFATVRVIAVRRSRGRFHSVGMTCNKGGSIIAARPSSHDALGVRGGKLDHKQLFEDRVNEEIVLLVSLSVGFTAEAEIAERVEMAADFVGLDRQLLDKSPFDISGGQKRRAAIAGIMAMRPDVLVLDEPAAGLDPQGRDGIFEGIVRYGRETGATVIIVSHSMEDMARFCDELIVMARARIAMRGNCAEIFSRANELERIGLSVPEITRLMSELKGRGIDVSESIYTVEDAAKALASVMKEK